jgi:predicted amidohydrolase
MHANPPPPLVAAVVQLTSTEDVAANLDAIARLVREAASAGAKFVALPENAAWLRTGPVERSPAESLSGPIISTMRELAESLQIHLLVGSFAEASENPARYYNTSVLVDGTTVGAPITATYRKLHLFDIDVAGGESQRESDTIAPGDSIVLADVGGVPTGLSICYDLRFARLYERLVDAGALMLTVPAAFTEFTGKDHWMVLLRARAIETQTFVIAPDQSGFHGGRRRSYGKSTIIDPWGIPLCTAGDGPGFALARLDFARQASIRASLPCLRHRHPRVHGA